MKNYKVIQTTFYASTPSERNYSKFSPKSLLQFAQEFMETWSDLDERNFLTEITSTYEQTGENQVLFTLNELDSIVAKCQKENPKIELLDVMTYLKKQR